MFTRRRVLQIGSFAVGGFVGSALTDTGTGTPASLGGNVQTPSYTVAPRVAAVTRSVGGCPNGTVYLDASVQEYDRGEERLLVCMTRINVLTGGTDCKEVRANNGIDVTHIRMGPTDRSRMANPTRRSTVTPTDETESSDAILHENHTETTSVWRVRLQTGQETTGYTFATTFSRPEDVEGGSPLVRVEVAAPISTEIVGTEMLQLKETLHYEEFETDD